MKKVKISKLINTCFIFFEYLFHICKRENEKNKIILILNIKTIYCFEL